MVCKEGHGSERDPTGVSVLAPTDTASEPSQYCWIHGRKCSKCFLSYLRCKLREACTLVRQVHRVGLPFRALRMRTHCTFSPPRHCLRVRQRGIIYYHDESREYSASVFYRGLSEQ